jgi:hypothetical protein
MRVGCLHLMSTQHIWPHFLSICLSCVFSESSAAPQLSPIRFSSNQERERKLALTREGAEKTAPPPPKKWRGKRKASLSMLKYPESLRLYLTSGQWTGMAAGEGKEWKPRLGEGRPASQMAAPEFLWPPWKLILKSQVPPRPLVCGRNMCIPESIYYHVHTYVYISIICMRMNISKIQNGMPTCVSILRNNFITSQKIWKWWSLNWTI